MVRWIVVLAAVAACDYPMGVVECADGTLCPSHLSCPATPGGACVDPNAEPAFCADKAEGTVCTAVSGGDGTCEGGECVETVCGDGVVEGREICDGGAGPETCIDLGFDYGRTACASDCGGSVAVTCGYIGWHDLELGLEPRFVNDVAIVGDEVWAAGDGGVYRYVNGTWTSVYGPPPQPGGNFALGWSNIAATSATDIWVFAFTGTAHWDGSQWTAEPSVGYPMFAEVSNGSVVVGIQIFGLEARSIVLRRVANAWEEEVVDPSGVIWANAFGNLGGVEVVAGSYLSCDAWSGSCSYGSLFFEKPPGQPWQPMSVPPVGGGYVESIAGASANDFVVTAKFPIAGTNPVEYSYPPGKRYVRSQSGTTVTSIAGAGWVVAAGGQYLALSPVASSATTYGGPGGERRVAVPGRTRLAASTGDRVVIAVDGTVYELGGALWSEAPTVSSDPAPALPDVTSIAARDISVGPAGFSILDKQRSVAWSFADPYGLAPAATELTRAYPNLVGIWGTGSQQFAFDTTQVVELVGNITTPLANGTPRDIAGNSGTDVMLVGDGSEFARQWNGTSWAPATGGTLTSPSLRAVAATGNGTYLAVGDGGLIARYEAGVWSAIDSGTSGDLRAISAIDATTFAAIGDRIVLRCTATGCTPDVIDYRTSDVAMLSPTDIVVVGDDGAVHFDGVDWSPIDLRALEPGRVAASGDAIWFGDKNPTGGFERLLRMRPWSAP